MSKLSVLNQELFDQLARLSLVAISDYTEDDINRISMHGPTLLRFLKLALEMLEGLSCQDNSALESIKAAIKMAEGK